MRIRIDKRAVVMLAMDFHEHLPGLPHQLHADRLIVHVSFRAAIRRLRATENQVAIVVYAIFPQELARRVIHRHVEDGGNLPLLLAMAHKTAIPAPAKRQGKTVKQYGFAGPGFARQHRETAVEAKIETFDQDDVADRKLCEHGCRS